jgi:hypothetical protein
MILKKKREKEEKEEKRCQRQLGSWHRKQPVQNQARAAR